MMLEAAALILFPTLMAYAAASDFLTMTISNRVSLALVGVFLALAVASGMPWRDLCADHLACGAAVLVLAFGLFAFGWIGGGDAKLAAATAVWLDWSHLFEYGLEASLGGAALTLGILHWRKMRLSRRLSGQDWALRLHAAGNGVPYGIALAAAGLAIYPETALWSAVAAS